MSLSPISLELVEFEAAKQTALKVIRRLMNEESNRERIKEIAATRRMAAQGAIVNNNQNQKDFGAMMRRAKDKLLLPSNLRSKKSDDDGDGSDDDDDDDDDDDAKRSVDDEDEDDDDDDIEEGIMSSFKANNQSIKVPYKGKLDIIDTRYKQAKLGQLDVDMDEFHQDQVLKFNLQNALNFSALSKGSAFMVGYQTRRAANILKKATMNKSKVANPKLDGPEFHNNIALCRKNF